MQAVLLQSIGIKLRFDIMSRVVFYFQLDLIICSPRSIYQSSNMSPRGPRLSDHFSIFGLVFIVLNSLLGIARQWNRENFAILTLKPRSHVRILIYWTCAIVPYLTCLMVSAVVIYSLCFMLVYSIYCIVVSLLLFSLSIDKPCICKYFLSSPASIDS